MARYRQGDIVLIPYPYTDLTEIKQRPVVIISKNNLNRPNYIVAKITSVIRNDQFSFSIHNRDLNGTIPKTSEVRTNEIFTVHEDIIIKKYTSFKPSPLGSLLSKLCSNIL